MIELRKLLLSQYLLYQDQEFIFEPGVTLVGGRNRVGKSLLLAGLRPIICGPTSDTKLPNGSNVRLLSNIISADGTTKLDVIGSTPGKTTSWKVRQNGIETKEHKKRVVRERIDRAFGMSASLFDSTVRLYNKNPSPLSYGMPSQRLEWLSDLFSLSEIYNELHKRAKKFAQEGSDAASKLSYLKNEYQRLGKRDKPDRKQLKVIEQRISALKAQTKEASSNKTDDAKLKEFRRQLSFLQSVRTALKTRVAVEANLEQEQQALDHLRDRYERAVDAERDSKAYDRQLARIMKDAGSVADDLKDKAGNLAALKRLEKAGESKLKEYKARLDQAVVEADAYEEYVEARAKAKKAQATLKALRDDGVKRPKIKTADEANQRLMAARAKLDDIRRHGNTVNCPECGFSIDKGTQVSDVENEVNDLQASFEWLKAQEQLTEFKAMTKPDKPESTTALGDRIQKGKRVLAVVEDLIELGERPKPLKNGSGDYKAEMPKHSRLLEKLEHDLELYDRYKYDEWPSHTIDELQEKIERLEQRSTSENKLQDVYDEISNLAEQKYLLSLEIKEYEAWVADKKRIKAEAEQLREPARQHEAAALLMDAFGREGMRLLALNEALASLNQEINALVPMLFDEKITFEIIAAPRRVDVIVTRNGKQSGIGDLSSSEDRCWRLLFAVALIKLLPSRFRCDTIILDEMEAHMDAVSKTRFAREFIPYLNTIVPKVIVVTPLINGELPLVPDRVLNIVKTGNQSVVEVR